MQVVLFHSALGLRPAVLRFAEAIAEGGHEVHTPDLFDGETFDNIKEGVAKRDALGIPELATRAAAAVEKLPKDLVYAGFSMGAASAQHLALTRPGARAAVLMHAALPPAAFGADSWPTTVPCEIHAAERDPWVEASVLEMLAAMPPVRVHRYPGGAHLFADEDCSDFDAENAQLMTERVRAFIAKLGS